MWLCYEHQAPLTWSSPVNPVSRPGAPSSASMTPTWPPPALTLRAAPSHWGSSIRWFHIHSRSGSPISLQVRVSCFCGGWPLFFFCRISCPKSQFNIQMRAQAFLLLDNTIMHAREEYTLYNSTGWVWQKLHYLINPEKPTGPNYTCRHCNEKP